MAIIDPACAKLLISENKYNFEQHICLRTGTILRYRCKHGPLIIIIYPNGKIIFKGSLHKFYNFISYDLTHNYNTFGFEAVGYVINYFKEIFNLDVFKLRIHNLEIGLNLKINLPVHKVIGHVLCYRSKDFFERAFDSPGRMVVCPFSEHRIKIYDKGMQENKGRNVLRLESHINKMRSRFNAHVYLCDFLDKKIWVACSEILSDMVNNITFNDDFNYDRLSINSKRIFREINDRSLFQKFDRRTKSRKLKAFNTLIDKQGLLKIKKQLSESILEEVKSL
ncbi:hypothetical protein [Pedobacter sp.]|uniref:hypothetical protein n=1 Tax=Pedobacter sp. TaxID=1411316 RepID=UPI003BA9475C